MSYSRDFFYNYFTILKNYRITVRYFKIITNYLKVFYV